MCSGTELPWERATRRRLGAFTPFAFTPSLFQFVLRDRVALGEGYAEARSIHTLRIHRRFIYKEYTSAHAQGTDPRVACVRTVPFPICAQGQSCLGRGLRGRDSEHSHSSHSHCPFSNLCSETELPWEKDTRRRLLRRSGGPCWWCGAATC